METYEYLTPAQVMKRFAVDDLSDTTQEEINERMRQEDMEASDGNVSRFLEPAGLDRFRVVTIY